MVSLRDMRAALVTISRRHSRVAEESEDLAHDLIVSALRRGEELTSESFLLRARGAARRHGAFLARSAGRRRAREALSAEGATECTLAAPGAHLPRTAPDESILDALSPTLRTTLHLLLAGLDKAELRMALGLTDTALRQRFQALRERRLAERPRVSFPPRTPAVLRLRQNQVAILPRLVHPRARATVEQCVAAGDPDGHGIIFSRALTFEPGAATVETSPAVPQGTTKGTRCSAPRSKTSPSSSSSGISPARTASTHKRSG